jgi:hypothetical protein
MEEETYQPIFLPILFPLWMDKSVWKQNFFNGELDQLLMSAYLSEFIYLYSVKSL